MKRKSTTSDFVIPSSTSSVLLSSSQQPSFVRNSTRFRRAAYRPASKTVVTERLDPKDAPNVYNYNLYRALETTSGIRLESPIPTSSSFISHRLPNPSTWFDSLPLLSTG